MMARRAMRRWLWAVAALGLGVSLAAAGGHAYPWLKGAAIYHGYLARAGRIEGHGTDLPAAASRCANCHDAVQPKEAVRVISPLTRMGLREPHPRRGGPPSAYDQANFCNFLHTGIDPAAVMADRTMPRFALDDGDCAALWQFVSTR